MRKLFFITVFLSVFVSVLDVYAKANAQQYGLVLKNQDLTNLNQQFYDSTFQSVFKASSQKKINFISRPHIAQDTTVEFYLIIGLAVLLGLVKTSQPKYFADVWRAFINPTLGSRQLKDIIQSAMLPNLLMNLFSSVVLAVYVYYFISLNVDWRFVSIPKALVVALLILGTVLVYLSKYMFIQFTGWAFNIRPSAQQYNFNIFLNNKVLGMVLLPFLFCFAFLNAKWTSVLLVISFIILIYFFVNRYLRSWNVFAPFFLNSRFHFFMYLCAIEILPLAVLLKVVFRLF